MAFKKMIANNAFNLYGDGNNSSKPTITKKKFTSSYTNKNTVPTITEKKKSTVPYTYKYSTDTEKNKAPALSTPKTTEVFLPNTYKVSQVSNAPSQNENNNKPKRNVVDYGVQFGPHLPTSNSNNDTKINEPPKNVNNNYNSANIASQVSSNQSYQDNLSELLKQQQAQYAEQLRAQQQAQQQAAQNAYNQNLSALEDAYAKKLQDLTVILTPRKRNYWILIMVQ